MSRKPPRWTIAFLRALERTGEVEASARDAGIDKSTAYLRRKSHSDFAEAWETALRRRERVEEAQVQERVGFWEKVKGKMTPKMLGSSATPPPTPPHQGEGSSRRREELLASTSLGGKMVRAGPGRPRPLRAPAP